VVAERRESMYGEIAMPEAGMVDVCDTADLWDGEMESFDVGGEEVLLIKYNGHFLAFQGTCLHQEVPLVEGRLENGVLTCRAHHWQFDAATGNGINPSNCRLKRYPVRIAGNVVQIGATPIVD
jgi:toluene monooxygenase system ferredoxin subunit